MTESLVVGVDAGATSTRVAVHTLDGTRVGYARAGAGNPSAHGLAKAVANIGEALAEALGAHDGAQVVASLAGVAGHVQEMVPELAKVWGRHRIPEGPQYRGDVTIGYAAGTAEPDGSLLLSGTGAVAARLKGYDLDALADGLGWLLGDAGSGFWIGRQAAKAAVAAFDRGLPVEAIAAGLPVEEGGLPVGEDGLPVEEGGLPVKDGGLPVKDGGLPIEAVEGGTGEAGSASHGGVLVSLVAQDFLGDERPISPRAVADRIVRLAQADHMRLASLSALVSRAAEAGDPAAAKIVHEAAGHLVATLERVHVAGPVVLAGSVLTSEGPVRRAVMELLAGHTVTTAGDAAGAAAWLAARAVLPEAQARAAHAAFTTLVA
ncbi:BadF/BadG/BcrA/BcrD ATPase family protein [Nonomuraea sp. NPDC046802]|uniref:BadF/BadG/BcrA/BcrD ATPase family protein n=1 Tax=Nonomuraea sp. NPDC046802 TaxID=3154919 RepID=UPI0033E12561